MNPMSQTPISGERVSLHPKSLADAPRDYIWRKDAELAALNGQPPLKISFIRYLTQFESVSASDHPTKEFLSIKTIAEGRHIGNCAIYEIDWDSAEAHVGIVIGDRRYWGQGYGSDAFKAFIGYAFNHLGMRRLHLKTLERNMRAQKCFTRCGFQSSGSLLENGDTYILMQLLVEDYVYKGLPPQTIAERTA
jgi:RimJ/RimL family protein N-acetyltransferase